MVDSNSLTVGSDCSVYYFPDDKSNQSYHICSTFHNSDTRQPPCNLDSKPVDVSLVRKTPQRSPRVLTLLSFAMYALSNGQVENIQEG